MNNHLKKWLSRLMVAVLCLCALPSGMGEGALGVEIEPPVEVLEAVELSELADPLPMEAAPVETEAALAAEAPPDEIEAALPEIEEAWRTDAGEALSEGLAAEIEEGVCGQEEAPELEAAIEPEAALEPEPSSANSAVSQAIEPEAAVTGEADVEPEPEQESELLHDEDATGLRLDVESLTLGVGEAFALKATLNGEAAKKPSFRSSNTGVAKVSAAGRITGKKAGSAVITVKCDGQTATCKVRVRKAPDSVSLNKKSLSLTVGETFSFKATLPSKTASALTWKSSKPAVATVDAAGRMTAVGQGTAKISVRTFNGNTATCKVTVAAAPTRITLSEDEMTIHVGQEAKLSWKLDKGRTKISLALGSKSIAAATDAGNDSAVIRGLRPGNTSVTVRCANGVKASARVVVLPEPTHIEFASSSMMLGVGQNWTLTPATDATASGAVRYKSSKKSVATVTSAGKLTAVKAGSATITATTCNGLSAALKLKVVVAPTSVKLSTRAMTLVPGESAQLTATVSGGADGGLCYTSSDPGVAEVTAEGQVTGVDIGTATITVITYNGKKAACKVNVEEAIESPVELVEPSSVTLDAAGILMMATGEERTIKATIEPASYSGGLRWETSSMSVKLSSDRKAASCAVSAASPGEARVTVWTDDGALASVRIIVVDPSDASDANLVALQRAAIEDESVMNGDVFWKVITARLVASNLTQSRAQAIVDKVRQADPKYRDIYVYALGSYGISGEATRDKRGAALGVSQFIMSDDTLYLTRSVSGDESYAYTALHESGHAVDYNAGDGALASENDEAVAALKADVRALLSSRVSEAARDAGVSTQKIDAARVVDAVMDARTLLYKDDVMAWLTLDEREVYEQLVKAVAAEMNATLPMNNGTMVWDALEGATNYAVSGKYGHAYLFNMPQYREVATYYFYDKDGTPRITAEPWAEFFSANVMKDAATIAANLSWLPKTCEYFSEVFAPKLVNYFKNLIKQK